MQSRSAINLSSLFQVNKGYKTAEEERINLNSLIYLESSFSTSAALRSS